MPHIETARHDGGEENARLKAENAHLKEENAHLKGENEALRERARTERERRALLAMALDGVHKEVHLIHSAFFPEEATPLVRPSRASREG